MSPYFRCAMRTAYQKKTINSIENKLFDNFGFNWKVLGDLVVNGGLPVKRRPTVREHYNLVIYDNHEDFDVPSFTPRKISRLGLKIPLDLYHHPRYVSLEYLRGLFNELRTQPKSLKMTKLAKQIIILEKELELKHNEVVLPGKYYRFPSYQPFIMDDFILFDPYKLSQQISHKFYKTKKIAPFVTNTPYPLPVFSNLGLIAKRKQTTNCLFDPNYWSLIYNRTVVGPSFLTSLRISFSLNFSSRNSLMIRSLRRHLRQLRAFKKYFFKRSYYLAHYRPKFDFRPYKMSFSNYSFNTVIYSVKGFWRSMGLAKNNRKYILNHSLKQSSRKCRIKIDIRNFVIPPKQKRGVKSKKNKKIQYLHTGDTSRDIGSLNLINFVTVSIKQLTSLDVYSEVPTGGPPYYTRHFKTKRRLRLKDTYAGRKVQGIRNIVFDAIKSKFNPIFSVRPTKKCLSGIALYFLNYKTRHHHRIRASDSPYSSRQKRFHRLLIVQGVIFEYWVDQPNLMLPGQMVQLQLQNFDIDKQFPRLNFKESVPNVVINHKEDLDKDQYKVKKEIFPDSTLKGYYKLKYNCYKSFAAVVPYIGKFVRFLKKGLKIFTEVKFFILMLFDGLRYIYDTVVSFLISIRNTSFVKRLYAISAIWNTSSAIEDSMFDINDHLSASHRYRHPNLSSFSEKFIPSMDELSYVDFDGEHPDDYDLLDGASRYYRSNFELSGVFEFGEEFWDDIVDFLIVDIPYYLLLFIRPILNLMLVYPIWSIIDLVCLFYVQIKSDVIFLYYEFLNSKVNNNIKRLVILARWLIKFSFLIIYVVCWLTYLDYNELQLLIVYTFDIPFHEFYYTIYVMFVVLTGFYIFGHHSFRSFIRDELGFENLAFLTFCTGSVVVQNYEVSPRPFNFTKKLYDYIRPKHSYNKVVLENWSRRIKTDHRGVSNRDIVSGYPLEPHFSSDDLEFLVQAQLWRDNPQLPPWEDKTKLFTSRFERKRSKGEFEKYDFWDDLYYVAPLFTDLDGILTSDKELKTPLTWYNSNEHYYHYHLYNRQGLIRKTDTGQYWSAPIIHSLFSEHESIIMPYSYTRSKTYAKRPGRKDPQTRRLDRSSDPALFGSDFE